MAALSTVAISLPLAFAQDQMSSSSASSAVSSVSSSSVSSETGPCAGMKDTEKLTCLGNQRMMNKEPVRSVRQNTAAHARIAACSDKTGLNKTQCLRSMQIGNKVMKETKSMQKAGKMMNKVDKLKGRMGSGY